MRNSRNIVKKWRRAYGKLILLAARQIAYGGVKNPFTHRWTQKAVRAARGGHKALSVPYDCTAEIARDLAITLGELLSKRR